MQLGLSESARVTTAEESRFRIEYPNSRPRVTRVIALDAASFAILGEVARHTWNDARFFRYERALSGSETLPDLPVDAVLAGLDGKEESLLATVAEADLIVRVTMTDGSSAASVIGNAALAHGKRATGMILAQDLPDASLAETLLAMRPFAGMLVVSGGEDYVVEMLRALRA